MNCYNFTLECQVNVCILQVSFEIDFLTYSENSQNTIIHFKIGSYYINI